MFTFYHNFSAKSNHCNLNVYTITNTFRKTYFGHMFKIYPYMMKSHTSSGNPSKELFLIWIMDHELTVATICNPLLEMSHCVSVSWKLLQREVNKNLMLAVMGQYRIQYQVYYINKSLLYFFIIVINLFYINKVMLFSSQTTLKLENPFCPLNSC